MNEKPAHVGVWFTPAETIDIIMALEARKQKLKNAPAWWCADTKTALEYLKDEYNKFCVEESKKYAPARMEETAS